MTVTNGINGSDGVSSPGDDDYFDYYPLDDGTLGIRMGKTEFLSEIVIPAKHNGRTVSTILPNAFRDASKMKTIVIPDSVTSIGNLAFYGCSGLTSVTVGNSVTSIGDYAFYDCSALTSITLPDSVTSIGNSAINRERDTATKQQNKHTAFQTVA